MIGQVGGIQRASAALVIIAGGIALAGCGGAAPPATPSSAATSSAAARASLPSDVPSSGPNLTSPGEKPPLLPAVAAQHSATGAAAFAKFFMQTIDWGFATTSGTYLAHYSDPACEQCQQIKSGLHATATQGWHFIGGRYDIKSSVATASGSGSQTATVTASVSAAKTVDASGTQQSTEAAIPTFTVSLELTWQSPGWLVLSIEPTG
jgi:hypothetical protein